MGKKGQIRIRFKVEFLSKWKDTDVLQKRIANHKFIENCNDIGVDFRGDAEIYNVNQVLDLLYQYGFTSTIYKLVGIERDFQKKLEETSLERLANRAYHNCLDFGPDVAEHETNLGKYFARTQSYYSVIEGKSKLIVEPKGSGKSAIKIMIYQNCRHSFGTRF